MKTLTALGMILTISTVVNAEPVHVAFNTPGYGPSGVQSYTRYEASVNRNFTFEALDQFMNPFGVLTQWHDDGFGMIGTGNYANDEIEGNERLMLRFNESVNVVGFDVTDFFYEVEPNYANCPTFGCYNEIGAAMFFYGDGSHSLFNVFSAPNSNTRATNGAFDIAVNESNVIGIMFASLGLSGFQLHEFALAGVTIDVPRHVPEVPEPATLFLVGSGLLTWGVRHRKKP